ncbi:Threonine/homoserine/homoserine lactone efflux protein [Chromohalobacter canadensis]|uniref:Threonine/homoserine/homoserine lactone efflux protein n=1 Tax=Chromohalobacter canadensis TaxID=141389 RepID=A0A285VBW5_9GAMM|nr:LysE family translocator [Chromohalobacter canadensis]SOC51493.1 Threonine/homoserine/homoserine lactone efflux protein [Chromohalobacter canadensis]
MFDYTLVHWLAFLSAAVLLNLSPGPDIAFMLGQTLRSGRRYGFAAMLGGWSGTALHVAMAAAGLSAILATSALAFSVIKWVGAAYLIWLGVKMLLSKGDSFVSNSGRHDVKAQSVYWQGVLVSVLNPKVAIFFLAFLPQFVVEGAGPVGAQLFLHGSLIIVVAAFIEPLLVMVGAKLGAFLKASPRVGMWMDRGLGSLFVALGARLAASTR